MPTENPQRLQDTFLSHLQAEKTPVTVFLINGVKLQGTVTGFDSFCISLARDGQMQAIYKQAVSTIMPAFPVRLWEDPDAEPKPQKRPRKPVVVERRSSRLR